jgi:1-aminocyclopropane-1-carboxylate synthase
LAAISYSIGKLVDVWIAGRCYPRSTLINLIKFCQTYQLHLISDEIYACSVFDSGEPNATPFTSILSIDTDRYIDPELLHVTYGLSKDFGVAGLRLGAIITRSKPILRAVEAVMRFHNPSGASLAIGTAMLEDRKWCRAFIESSREKLAGAYRHVTKGLREIGVDSLAGSNAGFFVWIDLSPYLPSGENAEFVLAQKLKDNGVFLHPQEEHSLHPGHFRIVFTQDPRTVTEGLRRSVGEDVSVPQANVSIESRKLFHDHIAPVTYGGYACSSIGMKTHELSACQNSQLMYTLMA